VVEREEIKVVVAKEVVKKVAKKVRLCDTLRYIWINYPHYRPWRPVGLYDIKDPTLSRQSAHRW
jgi:hypothetical protein